MEKTFSQFNPVFQVMIVVVIPILLVAGLGWANLQFVRQNPGGDHFLVYYKGTRALLVEGRSPYSDSVAGEIQAESTAQTPQEGEQELRFVHPLYSTVFFTPVSVISDFTLARAAWMSILEVVVLLTAYINLRLTEWKPTPGIKALYYLFTLAWYFSVRTVITGNVVILICFLISLMMLSIKEGWDRWAGVLLALSTITPHLIIFVVVLVWIWGLSTNRGSILKWFAGTLIVLVVGSSVLLPDWILQNLWSVLKFLENNAALSLGGVVGAWLPGIALQLRWIITAIVAAILLVEWYAARKKPVNHLLWAVALTLTASHWVGIPTHPDNLFILYPALVFALVMWHKRWEKYGDVVVAFSLGVFSIGIWIFVLVSPQKITQFLQSPGMLFPLPAFLLVTLYWVRFWVVHPTRKILE